MTLLQTFYLLIVSFSLYGVVKAINVYIKRREFRYLIILNFFLLFATQVWMVAYGLRLREFFANFQFLITLVPLLIFLSYDYLEKRRLKEQKSKLMIKNFFSKYVSPKIINKLLKQKKIELSGEKRNITVFFMDIRGFTKISENKDPKEIVKILNKYFNIATKNILEHNGTIDKFIGDAVMAIFNAPHNVKDHELMAFETAIEIQKEIQKWNQIEVGIGLNSGEAIVGNVGSKKMMDYTAIGNTVNTASRLEEQTKGGDIIISESIYGKIKFNYKSKKPEKVVLKGISQPIEIYRFTKNDY